MNGIIVFKGKYGATAQYAHWLGQELKLPVFEPARLPTPPLEEADILVVGTGLYGNGMLMDAWIQKNLAHLMRKRVFLFVVGGPQSGKVSGREARIRSYLPAEIRNWCEVYELPGRMNFRRLSLMDKFRLRLQDFFNWLFQGSAWQKDYDGVEKENLDELVNAIYKTSMLREELLHAGRQKERAS